ncbi:MAG: CRISPR-associated endonuclease Cas2 [Candidatus Krumholzibacteriia bacterium]
MPLSGFRAMWVLVMFDLPVKTKPQRKAATGFRKFLLEDGFDMIQYSVYSRPCPTDDNAAVHVKRVKHNLPPNGQVRILKFTDKQYGMMECFLSKMARKAEKQPDQIQLF